MSELPQLWPETTESRSSGASGGKPARNAPYARGNVGLGDDEIDHRDAFPISDVSRDYYHRRFPGTGPSDWNDWRWQARHALRTLEQINEAFKLTADEHAAIQRHAGSLPLAVPPYYASLLSATDPADPLRRTHIPVMAEYDIAPYEADDPLGEDGHMPVPNLVHRYNDRVLFLVTGWCFSFCRYCTRSRMIGDPTGEYHFSTREWDQQVAYIEDHPEIRDCLISGGDPLTLSDDKLERLLSRLRAIPHLDFIRIGTKAPVVIPQRVSRRLAAMLARHRVWVSLHVTHAAEITPEMTEACDRLADAGVPLGSQTVLLRGINDTVDAMRSLVHALLKVRVKPYYLYLCDLVAGSSHFRTTVAKGIEIIENLRGHTTGYAVPQLVIDAPGGGGKIPIHPNYVIGRDGDDLLLRNYAGRIFRYPDPPEGNAATSSSASLMEA